MEALSILDRRARGFERAVLASSLLAGAPLWLDRSIESLGPLDRYIDALGPDPGALGAVGEPSLGAYLLMVRAQTLGPAGLGADPGPLEAARSRLLARARLADYGARLRETAAGAPPREPEGRVQVHTLRVLMAPVSNDAWQALLSVCLGWLPEPPPAGTGDDGKGGGRSWIVDAEELRVDLRRDGDREPATLELTAPFAPRDDRTARLTDLWQRLFEVTEPILAVAFAPDSLAGMRYLQAGLEGAVPDMLFLRQDTAAPTGQALPWRVEPLGPYGVRLSGASFAAAASPLSLRALWPHWDV